MPPAVFGGQECRNWRGVACATLGPHLRARAQTVPCKGNRTVDKGEARGHQARSGGSEQKKIFIK